jgi:hypothetical protein
MGFLRKGLFVASGGLSGAAGVKANSKKERTAKALEQQNRLAKKAARPTAATSSTANPVYTIVNYDGGFPSHANPERAGTLFLRPDGKWEIRFKKSTDYIYGGITRYPMTVTPVRGGRDRICRVRMTDTQDSAISANFTVVGCSAEQFSVKLATYRAKLLPLTPPRPPIATASVIGVADEIAKLAELRKQGLLTEGEFVAQKSKLLGKP